MYMTAQDSLEYVINIRSQGLHTIVSSNKDIAITIDLLVIKKLLS